MAVFRVNKTKDYTIMSNQHLRDKELSLKAKGLLSVMLSLPDDWDYSLAGLVSICKEEETAIKSTLSELKSVGYVKVTKLLSNQTESGKFEYVYDIFESKNPEVCFPPVDIPSVEVPSVENQGQLNTKELNTKEQIIFNRQRQKEDAKKRYGTFDNVRLTDEELAKLKKMFPDFQQRIDTMSEYLASKGDKYKSHYATILNWYRRENGGKSVAEKEYF